MCKQDFWPFQKIASRHIFEKTNHNFFCNDLVWLNSILKFWWSCFLVHPNQVQVCDIGYFWQQANPVFLVEILVGQIKLWARASTRLIWSHRFDVWSGCNIALYVTIYIISTNFVHLKVAKYKKAILDVNVDSDLRWQLFDSQK